jgi:hypothetical protein
MCRVSQLLFLQGPQMKTLTLSLVALIVGVAIGYTVAKMTTSSSQQVAKVVTPAQVKPQRVWCTLEYTSPYNDFVYVEQDNDPHHLGFGRYEPGEKAKMQISLGTNATTVFRIVRGWRHDVVGTLTVSMIDNKLVAKSSDGKELRVYQSPDTVASR